MASCEFLTQFCILKMKNLTLFASCFSVERASTLGKSESFHMPLSHAPSSRNIEDLLFGTLPYMTLHLAVNCILRDISFIKLVNVIAV